MDSVARYLASSKLRHALVRLCHLALQPLADGRRALDDWEKNSPTEADLRTAIEQLQDDAKAIDAAVVASEPLLWLCTLDRHCYLETSPDAHLGDFHIIDNGHHFHLIRVYPGSKGGERRNQFGNVEHWLQHHRVIPYNNLQGIPVALSHLPRGQEDWFLQRLGSDSINVAIAHFGDNATVQIAEIGQWEFTCPGIDDENQRLDSVTRYIDQAEKEGIHILVMPEMTVTPEIRSKIVNDLERRNFEGRSDSTHPVPIIVLGSFHETVGGKYCNRATAVSGLDGTPLLVYDKRKSVTAGKRKECIDHAPTAVTCLITPLGLVAMTICKDLFEEAPSELLASLPMDWLLVPSMSNSVTPHKHAAKKLHDTLGTIVALANQEMPGNPDPLPGFIQQKQATDGESGNYFVVNVANTQRTSDSSPKQPYLRVVK